MVTLAKSINYLQKKKSDYESKIAILQSNLDRHEKEKALLDEQFENY